MTRQEFLTLQLAALDALKPKLLAGSEWYDYKGRPCATMALENHSHLKIDSANGRLLHFLREIIYCNDARPSESPAARFVRVRAWVAAQLGGES